jgi:hypothetical protein
MENWPKLESLLLCGACIVMRNRSPIGALSCLRS